MASMSVQRRDDYQSAFVPVWPNTSLMEHCANIAKVRRFFDRALWVGLTTSGAALGGYALFDGDKIQSLNRWRKPALIAMGGLTAATLIGDLVASSMLQKCSDNVLEGVGAKPIKSRAEVMPDRADESVDPNERSIVSYGVSAEAVARHATSPKTIAKGVLVVAAATAVAAVSAALYVFGLRGGAGMESVTPGFGATLDNESSLFGRQNTIL